MTGGTDINFGVRGTSVNGNNILIFDGAKFAKEVADQSLRLAQEGGFKLAAQYLEAMAGVSVQMNDNTTKTEK